MQPLPNYETPAEREQPPVGCRRHYWLDFILTLVVVVLAVGRPHLIRLAEHHVVMGPGEGAGFLVALVVRPLAILVAMAVVLLAIVRLFLKPRTLRHTLLRLAFPVVAIVALFVPTKTPGPLAAIFLEGFEHRILQVVDIDAAQQWLAAEGIKYAGQTYRANDSGFPPELPASLMGCHPWYVQFSSRDDGHEVTVEFGWPTRDGEYGVVIGPPSMKTPEVGMIRRDNGLYEFRRPVKPGAYVFCRG